MRFEGKTLEEALDQAAEAVGRPADDLQYRIAEDKKSFWGGRRVIVELITDGTLKLANRPAPAAPEGEEAPNEETVAEVTRVVRELLVAAQLRVEVTRLDALNFELAGEDIPFLLARQGEGMEALQTLTGRIAGKRLGNPVFPHLDADGFRQRRLDSLAQTARRNAEKVKQTKRKVLLDPMSPADRRLVHLTLSSDEEVETRSEGEGFFKRVAIFPRG